MRTALGISYDGGAFRGWQTQPSGCTVQDVFEEALSSFLGHRARTVCAGRTDAGVHALNQVVHVDSTAVRTQEAWLRGMNTLLPATVAVQWAQPVSDTFHARFSATARRYLYIIRNARQRAPLLSGRVGWVYRPLNVAAMRCAAQRLVGEHDFSSFRSADCQAANPTRHMFQVTVCAYGSFIVVCFHANAFLHHMIRNVMGALVYVGLGRQPPEWIDELLRLRDRRLSAPTFASDGLYLAAVDYPQQFGLPRMCPLAALEDLAGFSWAATIEDCGV